MAPSINFCLRPNLSSLLRKIHRSLESQWYRDRILTKKEPSHLPLLSLIILRLSKILAEMRMSIELDKQSMKLYLTPKITVF